VSESPRQSYAPMSVPLHHGPENTDAGRVMPPDQDIFGRALLDWALGGTEPEVLEREDGFTQVGAGPGVYLSEVKEWPAAERQSLRYLRGRALDVGCGAGRVSLELQRRGMDVVGLDTSPLAARAAMLRGVNDVWSMSLEDLGESIESFDSLVLFGNNFGIFQTAVRARRTLTRLSKVTAPGTRIFVESTDAFFGGAPAFDRTYYHRNKALGRSPGQLKVRYHYGHLKGPWFRWIYVSRREMRTLLTGTGWHTERVIGSQLGEPYVAILTKDQV
jgi:SAM-dependent methyltransferase